MSDAKILFKFRIFYHLRIFANIKVICFSGSVNAGNSADLAKQEDIDGFLVGGASLKVHNLFKISLTRMWFIPKVCK